MLARLTLFFLFIGCFTSMHSQDLLVTQKGDSLNCEVEALHDGYYPITFMLNDRRMTGLIHKDSVSCIRKKMYRNLYSNKLRPWFPLMEWGVDIGAAHQIGVFRKDFDLTSRNSFHARTGYYIGTDLTLFVSKQFGYGIKYNYRSLLEGDLSYQYIGPTVHLRLWDSKKKNNFFLTLSVGYGWMSQKDAPIQLGQTRPRIEMSAGAFTSDISIGRDFRLSNVLAIRTKLSGILGFPKFKRIKDVQKYVLANDEPLELGNYCQNMNTINLSIGLVLKK